MGALRATFVEHTAEAAVPGRWRLEQIPHAELSVWVAVAEDDQGELLLGVGLSDRAGIDAHAERHGARVEQRRGLGPARSEAATQLRQYLTGERRDFDLRVLPLGTAFARRAWAALCSIPFGQTRTYAEQARIMSSPGAARAVGRANGSNPVPIVVPCHRVIGSDGSLTGFAGGLGLKRWLLAHEGVGLPSDPQDQLALF